VTVRALHHYDEIGLVPASERTPAGHRRYTGADVRRLYRVLALHRLGLSLADIAAVLDAPEDPDAMRLLLTAQLAYLDARAEAIARRRDRVSALLARVDGPGQPTPEELLTSLERGTALVDPRAYLTESQRAALARRGRELGPAMVDALREEWLGLVEQGRKLVRDGVPVDDPRAASLAARWREIAAELRGATEADAALDASVARAWQRHGTLIDQGVAERSGRLAPGDLIDVVGYVTRVDAEGGR